MAKKNDREALRFNAWTLGANGADVFEKSAEALELERMNPLRGVDEWRLGQIFDDARDGIYADLAWLYNEIEGVEPALLTCCDARESASSECGWLVKTADAKYVRAFDQTLAEEQRDALLAEFGAVEDDLAELAGHLVSSFFRGAAHARALWNQDGSLAGFQHLDLWNFALDKKTCVWYWNADASRDGRSFQPIAPGELVSVAVSRHVDHAALPIFIRAALGAKRYGVWLDRFGIPPVGIIMPPTAEKGDQAAYMDLARKFARGGSGILPNASQIVYGTEARAVCPFTDFIRFQQQQIYTVGLGRVQSGETSGDNLGGNAAGVVESGFRRIVRRDARRIARAINDGVTAKIIARIFPGRPVLAQFAWDTDEKRTGREVLDDAVAAKNAGLEIDLDQLRELTGYTLSKAPETPVQPPFNGLPLTNKAETPFKTPESPFKISPKVFNAQGDGKRADASEGVLDGSQEGGRAESIFAEIAKTILDGSIPYEEALKKAQAQLDGIDADNLAADLEKELEKAMFEAAAKAADDSADADGRRGLKAAPPVENAITNPCPKCHRQMSADGTCSFCAKRAANHSAGKSAFEEVSKTHKDKVGAMERDSIGKIDFIWGDDTEGICHILGKHKTSAQQIPGVLAYGDVYESKTENKFYIIKKRYVAVLRKRTGSNHYLITGFKAESPDYAAKIRKECRLVEDGE